MSYSSDLDTVCMDSVYSSFTSLREKLDSSDISENISENEKKKNNKKEKEDKKENNCCICCFFLSLFSIWEYNNKFPNYL